jgi:hypothetical protein
MNLVIIVPAIACGLIKGISAELADVSADRNVFAVIADLLTRGALSYEALNGIGFLRIFVLRPIDAVVSALLAEDDFETHTRALFKLSKEQGRVISRMLRCDVDFRVIAAWIRDCPRVENMQVLVECGDPELVPKVYDILRGLFSVSAKLCGDFVRHVRGMEWLFQMNLSVDQLMSLLTTLSASERFEEIDRAIERLGSDHPLFALPTHLIEKIVYGANCSHFRPIRVASLYQFLPSGPGEFIDPYNGYLLGSSGYPSLAYDAPNIESVANRCLLCQHIGPLLTKPYELERLCLHDKYDHFSLFQFYSGDDPLILNVPSPHRAISFWFRVHEAGCSSQFFECDFLRIKLSVGTLEIFCGSEHETIALDPTKWNHLLSFGEERLRLYVRAAVKLNDDPEVKFSVQSPDFTFAKFFYQGTSLLFLGFSICLFKNTFRDVSKILPARPEASSPILEKCEECVVTPSGFEKRSVKVQKSPTSFSVQYFGFPYHFISLRRLSDLFSILANARSDHEFQAIFSTLLRVNEITRKNTGEIWEKVLCALKEHPSWATEEILVRAIRSIGQAHTSSLFDSFLRTVLFDHELWMSIDNTILVSVLFDNVKEIDAPSLHDDFESFPTTVVLHNPGSQAIVDKILANRGRIPKLIKALLIVLRAGHVIDAERLTWDSLLARSDMEVQHTITRAINDFLSPQTLAVVRSWLPFPNLNGILSVATRPLARYLFHLMVDIELLSANFIVVDEVLLVAIAPLSSHPLVWDDLFKLRGPKFLPLMVSAVFGAAVSFVNCLSAHARLNDCLALIEACFSQALDYLRESLSLYLQNCSPRFSNSSIRSFSIRTSSTN